MTDPGCRNGTERVHAALGVLDRSSRAVINLQGDAVLTPPWVIEAVVSVLGDDDEVEMATPAVRLTWPQHEELHRARAAGVVGGTTVTRDEAGNALYFSKALIPNVRDPGTGPCPVLRHIGLYGYTTTVLARLLELEPGPLEKAEHLEQLRALEHGIRIRVVEVDYRGRTHGSVDNPGDVATVEEIIRREGELVP
jgi:3-deoxy-manno-octulosonate cytidylyltransferase (CMP-KDO synthetase)